MTRLGRWLRWLFTGAVSVATPLPWLVDVTAARFDELEARVSQLERENVALLRLIEGSVSRGTWVAPDLPTKTTGSGLSTWTTLS